MHEASKKHLSNIYETCIKHLWNSMYHTFMKHLSTIYEAFSFMKHGSNIYQTCSKHLSNMYQTFMKHLPNIYQAFIKPLANLKQVMCIYIRVRANHKYTYNLSKIYQTFMKHASNMYQSFIKQLEKSNMYRTFASRGVCPRFCAYESMVSFFVCIHPDFMQYGCQRLLSRPCY